MASEMHGVMMDGVRHLTDWCATPLSFEPFYTSTKKPIDQYQDRLGTSIGKEQSTQKEEMPAAAAAAFFAGRRWCSN
jgi:hypothetical protein